MRRIYDIDLYKLLRMLLPSTLRGSSTVVAMLEAMFTPMQRIYSKFTQYGDSIEKQLSYSSQTCRLRAMLNDVFDPTERRIVVENREVKSYPYIHRVEENLPIMIGAIGNVEPLMLFSAGSAELLRGFSVLLPNELYQDKYIAEKVQGQVDKYRLATRYMLLKPMSGYYVELFQVGAGDALLLGEAGSANTQLIYMVEYIGVYDNFNK
ncbi:MAG: hypothetical protein ACRC3G_01175 [Bacteroidales bacterium]